MVTGLPIFGYVAQQHIPEATRQEFCQKITDDLVM